MTGRQRLEGEDQAEREPVSPVAAPSPMLRRSAMPTAADVRRMQPLIGNRAVSAWVGRSRLARTPLSEARGTVASDREYRAKAAELESKLGPHLSANAKANEIANELLGRLKRVVDAWADATNQSTAQVYGTEFHFPDGRNYYGSFAQTGESIKRILDDIRGQPLRTKLNTVYYSVRSNTFAKFLESAAMELMQGGNVDVDEGVTGKTRTVKSGFAQQSGFKDVWDKQTVGTAPGQMEPKDISDQARMRSQSQPPPLVGVKSDSMNAQLPVVDSRGDKVYDKNVGLGWDDQPTLEQKDVTDITVDELKLLHERDGGVPSTIPEHEWLTRQQEWKKKPTDKVRWEMGVASIDIKPGSQTRVAAEKFRARLDAGISGSTDLMMHAAVHLGLTSQEEREALRLALVAWMLSNRDHSFYEIMLAAEGYGVPFVRDEKQPGSEYESVDNFKPLGANEVKGFKGLMSEGELPSHYFNPTRVKHHESQLPNVPEPDVGKELGHAGVKAMEVQNSTPELFFAYRESLEKRIVELGFQDQNDDEHALRRNRVRMQTLREDMAFQWLALHHTGGATYAETELVKLIEAKHPSVLVSADLLKQGKVPDSTADNATPIERLDLQRLVIAVKEAWNVPKPNPNTMKTQLPYLGVKRFLRGDAELLLTTLINALKPVNII